MAAFEYNAMDGNRAVRGVVQAETARQARQELRERGLIPLDVGPFERHRPGAEHASAASGRCCSDSWLRC